MKISNPNHTISYRDYKNFENILTDTSIGTKQSVNPIEFFLPTENKSEDFNADLFIKLLFSGRIVRLPYFRILDESVEKFNRFEDYTKKNEVNNIALWILSAFQYLSKIDINLGKEIEIYQQNNPRDGRLDVVALRENGIIVIETKTDLRSLLNENRFTYQIENYTAECLKYMKKYLKSDDLTVLLGIGGDETDIFPPDHIDCITGKVGDISKIFYDKILDTNIKFISANAIWGLVAYQLTFDKEIDLYNLIKKIYSRKNVFGLLSGGVVTEKMGKLFVEPLDLRSISN